MKCFPSVPGFSDDLQITPPIVDGLSGHPSKVNLVQYFDSLAATRDQWIKKNWYYHQELARALSFFVPADSSVLEMGSSTGMLLSALKPKRGLGLDISPAMVEIARHKYPELEFRVDDIEELKTEEKFDLLVVLSGPEPERTRFNQLLVRQLKNSAIKVQIVRGISEGDTCEKISENLFQADFMKAQELNEAFLSSEIILSRSGYSTVMDLAITRSKAILIPTKSQTEQEYLARKLRAENIFYTMLESEFDLSDAVAKAKKLSGFIANEENLLPGIIAKWLASIS